jgi:DNA-binding NarL/FixJ family response regulator
MEQETASRAAKILIVDDHPVVRLGLRQLLEAQPGFEVVGEAGDATEALRLLESEACDLALVDISLNSGSGIELIKQIRERHPEVKMLVSSMHDEALYAERALRAGAMGYINKQDDAEQLVGAIRQVLEGRIYLSKQASERTLQRMVGGSGETETSPLRKLSDRELQVFEFIGRGLTTREIAKRLSLSTKTIETHREKIKFKMGLKNGIQLVRAAVQWTQTDV